MMAAPIHASDEGIGRARQFVMRATFDQAAKHGIADLFVMDRERCNIRRAYLPTNSCRLARSEEHTSELQSLMRISYAVFCLKKKKTKTAILKKVIRISHIKVTTLSS